MLRIRGSNYMFVLFICFFVAGKNIYDYNMIMENYSPMKIKLIVE